MYNYIERCFRLIVAMLFKGLLLWQQGGVNSRGMIACSLVELRFNNHIIRHAMNILRITDDVCGWHPYSDATGRNVIV